MKEIMMEVVGSRRKSSKHYGKKYAAYVTDEGYEQFKTKKTVDAKHWIGWAK